MTERRRPMLYLEYFLRHLYISAWVCFIYYSVLFVSIPGLSVNASKIVFFLGNQVIWLVISAFTPAKERNKYNVFFNVILSYTPYFLITYLPVYKKFITPFVVIAIVLSVLYSTYILCKKVKNKKNLKRIIRNRVKLSLKGTKFIASVMACILLITSYWCTFFGVNLNQSNIPTLQSSNAEEAGQWTIKNNMDTLKLLQEEEWCKLSTDKKLEVLSVVRNIETAYLGLSHEIRLTVKPTDTNTLGYYNHKERTVVISHDHITSGKAKDCLHTICHEMQHAYQHNQIEACRSVDEKYKNMPMFYLISIYEKEFNNYISGEEDVLGYLLQKSEINADKYAEKSVEDYYKTIKLYLSEEKEKKAAQT